MLKLDLDYLLELLIKVGRDEQLSRFAHVDSRKKADGSLVTEADIGSQRVIRHALAEKWPQAAFLGEEMTGAEQEAVIAGADAPLWVLDPLDGTTNYASGIPFFGISLALVEQGEVRFGMVHDPCRNECFWAEKGKGAWLNGEKLSLEGEAFVDPAECVALLDFKRLSSEMAVALVKKQPYRSQRCLGSVALEWCWLAAGRGRLYLHGGQKLWDYAAGRLIFREAGGVVFDDEVRPPGLAPRQAIAASNEALLSFWVEFLRKADKQFFLRGGL